MQKLRLKAIKFGCDFRYSEASNYEELVKKKHFPGPPGKGEVYLLVSRSENQLLWIFHVGELEGKQGRMRSLVDTRRWRLLDGTWNYRMLENYANDAGFSLSGFKRLEAEFQKD